MDKLIFMQIGDSTENLCYDLRCVLLRQEHSVVNVLIDLTEKISALAKLGHDKETLFVLEYLLEAQYIWMIQVLQ